MNQAFVVSAVRTPVGKAPNGALRYTRPDEMAATAISEALRRVPSLDPAEVDDVILGCAMPMSTVTLSSTAPDSSAIHDPNENPAAHRFSFGKRRAM